MYIPKYDRMIQLTSPNIRIKVTDINTAPQAATNESRKIGRA